MQIAINISDNVYERIKYLEPNSNSNNLLDILLCSVQNGTPIPKGHGRIMDVDKVINKMEEREEKLKDDRSIWETAGVETALDMFGETIIEADAGE